MTEPHIIQALRDRLARTEDEATRTRLTSLIDYLESHPDKVEGLEIEGDRLLDGDDDTLDWLP